MDNYAGIQKIIRKAEICSKAQFVRERAKQLGCELPGSFMTIFSEYANDRLDAGGMYQQVSRLFRTHPEVIEYFCALFPEAKSTKRVNVHDSTETLVPAKKAKIEDDSRIAITEFGSTSNASTSYASDSTQYPCSSGWYSIKRNTVASGSSSSSQSWPGYAADAYEAEKEKTPQWIDRTLFVTQTETRLLEAPQAYGHLTELVEDIRANRTDTCAIMERASKLLQGYPELIESFSIFLPDGYSIVTLPDDHKMSTG